MATIRRAGGVGPLLGAQIPAVDRRVAIFPELREHSNVQQIGRALHVPDHCVHHPHLLGVGPRGVCRRPVHWCRFAVAVLGRRRRCPSVPFTRAVTFNLVLANRIVSKYKLMSIYVHQVVYKVLDHYLCRHFTTSL